VGFLLQLDDGLGEPFRRGGGRRLGGVGRRGEQDGGDEGDLEEL
jgi:hypothetical protein